MTTPKVLSIAGTDPTGGAGTNADQKAIAALGGYALSVVTALVAQNTCGVRAIHTPPVDFLREQLDAVSCDVTLDAIKVGMLGTVATIAAVGEWLGEQEGVPVVLDPVMVSTSGHRLLEPDAEGALREMLSCADVVTPNVPELEILTQRSGLASNEEVAQAALSLADSCGTAVLAKGGHLESEASSADVLVLPDGDAWSISCPRVTTSNTHGTGCSLSSAMATLYPVYGDWPRTVSVAKAWLTAALAAADSLDVGRGNGPVHHMAHVGDIRSMAEALPAPTVSVLAVR